MVKKIEFITFAINDAQATIRAIDVKVGALLTGMLIPLSSLGKIWSYFDALPDCLALITRSVFFLFWILSVAILIKTISAISNPADKIEGRKKLQGVFYGGGIYRFNILNSLFNLSRSKEKSNMNKFVEKYPEDDDSVIAELAFEHMKLIYIRDIKLFRLRIALNISVLWLIIGVIAYFCSRV